MKVTKEKIEKVLGSIVLVDQDKTILESGAIKNIQVFGSEVELDIEVQNPTLQYKKNIEKQCLKAVDDYFSDDVSLKINFSIKSPKKETQIKGNPIPGVKNIVAVSSGKGGVGKSTIAANLAVGLAKLDYKVGVIDADIYGPSMHIMFGLEGEKPLSINVDGKGKIKPLESHGVKLLSIGFFAQSEQAVAWRGPMASKALNQFLWDTHWGELDYLVIDLPPGTGDAQLTLAQSSKLSGSIIVSTPQDVALIDVRKGINMFKKVNVPILGLVENMSYF